MGLGVSLSNALSGMNVSQNSLDILSRNVANAGTPGYHRQSLSVIDTKGANSPYARSGGVERAFSQSLQAYYTSATSQSGYTTVMAGTLDRLQTYLGMPGDPGSLDTMFSNLQTSLQQLATSPENYATRASVVSNAQQMANTLNSLTGQVQGLRQEAESRISTDVDSLNQYVSSLGKISARLSDQTIDASSRATLLDQRDRLVSQISEIIDVRVEYHGDDSVALMTRSGVGILDGKASLFEFQSGGTLAADKAFSVDSNKNGVGRLLLHTPAGLSLDLVQQGAIKSGELAGLIELRDSTLVTAQNQLDEIAAGLAQALSTNQTPGTAVVNGAASGFDIDLSSVRDGNDVLLNYTENGASKSVRIVRVDDTSKLPLDYLDANGARVVGLDFNAGTAAVATALGTALGPGLSVSTTGGSVLRVLDDGAGGTTDVTGLTARTTATGTQNGGLALSLFVDTGNTDFTNSLGGAAGQKRGFAGRISVNSAILADSKLLVQYAPNGSLGDPARANMLTEQLSSMGFASAQINNSELGKFRLGGTVSDLIAQTMNYQGNVAASASDDSDTQQLTMDALDQRMKTEYGVNVDDEMARLMELQNAYAANARVVSVVQELLDRLMQI